MAHSVLCVFLLFPILEPFLLQKLPFTIPELVHASPCRSSDGVFYTGEYLCSLRGLNPANKKGDLGPVKPTWPGEKGHTSYPIMTLSYMLSSSTGRKQDAWFVVDPESGETQMTLTTEGFSTPQLYIGRTRKSDVLYACKAPYFSLSRLDSCYLN